MAMTGDTRNPGTSTTEPTQSLPHSGACDKGRTTRKDRTQTVSEQSSGSGLQSKRALCVHRTDLSPDLARVVDTWPALPVPIRKAILAMVRTATGEGGDCASLPD